MLCGTCYVADVSTNPGDRSNSLGVIYEEKRKGLWLPE